jgi:hypothetical protein
VVVDKVAVVTVMAMAKVVVPVAIRGSGSASTGGCGGCHGRGHALDTLSSLTLHTFVFINTWFVKYLC